MKSAKHSWDDLRILLAVHRSKSFLLAGKTLGIATSTVARRVAALERAVGRPLVHKGNDGTRLDPDAQRLVALGEEMELGFAALRRDAPDSAAVSGSVRVSLSKGFVRPMTRVLARVHVKHPALAIELMAESRMTDLARREADIGIRIARSTSPSVVSRAMGRARTGLFAAREYVARRMASARLPSEQAGQHDWVSFDQSLSKLPQEAWLRTYGASRFVFRSNSAAAIEQAVLSGMGIGLLTEAQGAALDGMGLVQLETDAAPPDVHVFVAYHRDARKTPRVQVVVRELALEMRRHLV